MLLSGRIDAVVKAEDASVVLKEVFGHKYSNKHRWP
jgi:hypothetical protein